MVNSKKLEELAQSFANSLPPGVKECREEIVKNFQSVLTHLFAKMDLVTREEFDAQQKVLERTREKLAQLEQLVAELEAAANDEK